MVRKILVVMDDRPVTQSAIDQAIEMAQTYRADIFFFYVLTHYRCTMGDMLSAIDVTGEVLQTKSLEEASRLLAVASAWAERCGVHSHRATSMASDAIQAVTDAAAKRHCDLIVVGTEDNNAVVRLLSGSIIPGLIFKATVPVLVCKDRPLRTKRNSRLRRPMVSSAPVRETGTRNHDEPND